MFHRSPDPILLTLSLIFLLLSACLTSHARSFSSSAHDSERKRSFRTLEDDDLSLVAQMDPQQWIGVTEGHLKRLLVPRAAGSENNTIVREYIKSVFDDLGWHIEEDTFIGKTPEGDKQFTNLIFTFDPDGGAATKLVLAAHHDSKWFPDFPANQFVGATDSAAPCAMLLDLAEAVTPALQARKTRLAAAAAARADNNESDDDWNDDDDDDDFDEQEAASTTLQFIFFDGEEAFHDWTATDSIYGSRHLAAQWESTFLPPSHAYQPLARRRMDPTPTMLSTIEHLVLLDLLGSAQPRVMQWYKETGWLFNEMRGADVRLRESKVGAFGRTKGGNDAEWFSHLSFGGSIEDDQVPFIERGVNVLHIIPYPFPTVWHTINDDASALDLPTMQRWNLILRVFTMEYLGLRPLSGAAEPRAVTQQERRGQQQHEVPVSMSSHHHELL